MNSVYADVKKQSSALSPCDKKPDEHQRKNDENRSKINGKIQESIENQSKINEKSIILPPGRRSRRVGAIKSTTVLAQKRVNRKKAFKKRVNNE